MHIGKVCTFHPFLFFAFHRSPYLALNFLNKTACSISKQCQPGGKKKTKQIRANNSEHAIPPSTNGITLFQQPGHPLSRRRCVVRVALGAALGREDERNLDNSYGTGP